MLDTWTERNRVVSQGLVTQYQQRYDADTMPRPYYEVKRIRTKTYRYIGLSADAARTCVEDMQAYWTRTFPSWVWNGGSWEKSVGKPDSTYQDLVADVALNHVEGGIWEVAVQVNEVAIIYSKSRIDYLETAFDSRLGKWEYDE